MAPPRGHLSGTEVSDTGPSWPYSIFSSPEHEVLMVSYCGQSLSVVHRRSSVVRRQQLL